MPSSSTKAMPAHPALGSALRVFRDQERQRVDPVVAILGPTGCGKTALLHDLLARLAVEDGESRKWACIPVDLGQVPLGPDEEMYRFITRQIAHGAAVAGVELASQTGVGAQRMQDMIEAAAKAVDGRLVLAIDHFNCVPQAFAQELSQRLRGMKEGGDNVFGVGGMALVIAGSLSLFRLTRSEKSAFHMARLVELPVASPEECRAHLGRVLREIGWDASDEWIDLLYRETRGEPAFLRAALSRLRQGVDLQLLGESIAAMDADEIPHLRHIGLHWYLNEPLRKIVSELLQGHRVPPRSMAPDIDENQLTGVVTLDTASGTYVLRNGMVKRFITALSEGRRPPFLREVEDARFSIRLAPDASTCRLGLEGAWDALVGYPEPGFQIVFGDRSGRRRDSLELTGRMTPPASAEAAWIHARRAGGTAFAVDEDTISVALPLNRNQTACWLVSTVGRSAEPFTEFTFEHWRGFISSVADTLAARALEAMLERNASMDAGPAAGTASRAVSRLILHDFGAVVVNGARTQCFSGRADNLWAERANRSDFVKDGMSKAQFNAALEEVGDKVKAAVDPIRGLNDQFREDPASHHWILSSNMSGLKIPIELLHVQRTPLCLHTGVARQIVEYPPPRNSRRTLAEALAELRHKGIRLRALLVGVDPDDELPVEEEIAGVEKEIEEGCARMGMAAPAIDILTSARASADRLRDALKQGYHFFHFCGHGLYTQIRLNNAGTRDDVPSSLLKEWLRDTGVMLCFMSACYTGQTQGDGLLTSSGMIEDLLTAGIPNIVSFRWAVSARSRRCWPPSFTRPCRLPEKPPSRRCGKPGGRPAAPMI